MDKKTKSLGHRDALTELFDEDSDKSDDDDDEHWHND